ncbi:MAG: HAMP domain-containing sensor histidine kinase, partial [Acidobacteriota bacterium]|nr:HAMP domain-containing sensor histidine kinase [Acidobacteriota bacterium]
AQRVVDLPLLAAQHTADDLARSLGARLEELRESESARPYQHYMHQYHGAGDDCGCPTGVTSPLAAGGAHHLIAAHFQIDDLGRVSLPTLGGAWASEPDASWVEEQRALLDLLASATPSMLQDDEGNAITTTPVIYTADDFRAEFLERPPETLITLGPLRWRTTEIGGESVLAALREVTTDHRLLTQGFIVSNNALKEYVERERFPVVVAAGAPEGPGEAALPLSGVEWCVRVDAREAVAGAAHEAGLIRKRFVRVFLIGTLAVFLAGVAVVAVLWQSERLSVARARFAAAAAHELRSPLTGIRLYSEMLADDLGKPEKAREYARKVARETEQLGRVVGNVLGYSRLERGRLPIRAERGDLLHSVEESIERVRPSTEASGARVRVVAEDDLPQVVFDPDAVHHIVQNLVDNAAKFSRDARDRTIDVRLATHNGGVALSVVDHGPGVPGRMRRRLFRAFDTAGDHHDENAGLGLGLVLVRALIEAHGGSVACSDTPSGGATFTVHFPR